MAAGKCYDHCFTTIVCKFKWYITFIYKYKHQLHLQMRPLKSSLKNMLMLILVGDRWAQGDTRPTPNQTNQKSMEPANQQLLQKHEKQTSSSRPSFFNCCFVGVILRHTNEDDLNLQFSISLNFQLFWGLYVGTSLRISQGPWLFWTCCCFFFWFAALCRWSNGYVVGIGC